VDIAQTIILSAVEGITEFLPISSTGHLILVSQILGVNQTEFVKSFEIIIQFGAILAVVALYWKRFLDTKIWPQIISAFIPTAVIGFLFFKIIKNYLIGNSTITVIALVLGGVAFIVFELWNRKRDFKIHSIEELDIKKSFAIGLVQSISIIPGVSRAGATILGSMILGVDRKTATQFSFFLAVPTMLAATGFDVIKTQLSFSTQQLTMLAIGFLGSFVFALFAVKLLIKYVSNHDFIPFGVYRILVGVAFYVIFLR